MSDTATRKLAIDMPADLDPAIDNFIALFAGELAASLHAAADRRGACSVVLKGPANNE